MRRFNQTLVLSVLSILISSSAIGHPSDACKNVKFKFTNKHNSGGTIEVRQVKYFNKANGEWQTEDVKHLDFSQGATCTTSGDNLRDSEGEELTKFRFVYRYQGRSQQTTGPMTWRAATRFRMIQRALRTRPTVLETRDGQSSAPTSQSLKSTSTPLPAASGLNSLAPRSSIFGTAPEHWCTPSAFPFSVEQLHRFPAKLLGR